ncbi:hypothetical protein [Clostridium lacusfryxellense]|uniref:hypothetical protein n=1 Tax=Clostridium lacusfryxellense TaxID=205328 RepID=UPI001C0BE5A1|nr:hypothetical protein [Clostridium lacusfryxellense]MBU3111802.1 hypothetical protein [Clostridium lacusfryxellense]
MTGMLIFIGLILVILNVLSIKKGNKSFNGVLGNAIGNVQDNDIIVGELRREFSESILELQSEIMDMREIMEKNNIYVKNSSERPIYRDNTKTNIEVPELEVDDEDDNVKIYEKIKDKNNNGSKVDEIKRLFGEGLALEEVAEIMHLGKGEVLLIKDLYIR